MIMDEIKFKDTTKIEDVELIRPEGANYTRDYDKFNTTRFNRPIKLSHVTKLIRSISLKDLSMQHPILVNKSFDVLDGQHRFLALKTLNKPIWYIISDKYDYDDLISLNSAVKPWCTTDYIEFYVQKGKQAYIDMVSDSNDYGVPLPLIANYLLRGFSDVNAIREGKLEYTGDQREKIKNLGNSLKMFGTFDFTKEQAFIKAFISLTTQPNYKAITMKTQIDKYGHSLLVKHTRQESYYQNLAKLFNYNRPKNSAVKVYREI